MSTAILITAEDFSRMSFEGPVELVCGEVVEMTRPGGVNGVVCFRCAAVLDRWLPASGSHLVVINDAGVITGRDPDTVRGPDLFVVARDRLPGGRIPEGHFSIAPEVCVEVQSPHERWSDLIAKVAEYLSIGVREVWIIVPGQRRVHVYRADTEPDVLSSELELVSQALPAFHCPVAELFRGLEPASESASAK
ncbi:MAG: Uma2 family endonuclease [Planctomyces sp.]|nr:Uma2 family endonuclease [Planctomyces sp.]